MAVVIVGGNSGVQQDVDATPRAGRVILYDASGSPISTLPVSAASLPLPTGASTSANQTNGNQQSQIVQGGTVAAVKAAAIAALAADPALVVALSPNNTPFQFGGDNRLRVGQETLLFYDTVEGTTIDTGRWVQSQSGMTQTQAAASLTLNAGSSVTTGNYSILTSARQLLVTVEFPIYVQFRARIVSQNNAVEELGFGVAATTAAPTDGAFFRIDAAGLLKGVINFNGTETLTASLGSLTSSTYYNFEITIFEDKVVFEVTSADGVTNISSSLAIPAGQGSPTSSGHLPVYARVYNSGTPGAAAQIIIASVSAQQMDLNTNSPWSEQISVAGGRNAIVDPTTYVQSQTLAAAAAPSNAAPTNVAVKYTTLGGEYFITMTAASENLLGVFGYTVPSPFALVITDIFLPPPIITTAFGATATTMIWALQIANNTNPSTATGPRYVLGTFGALASAAVGTTLGGGSVALDLQTPLVVPPGQVVLIMVKNVVGIATGVYRGTLNINGYFL